jgi:opacity protein-like surface antigen
MKKRILSLSVVSLAAFSVSPSVLAACSLPKGFYLEYNWGATRSMAKSYPGVTTIDNSGTGWNGTLGYKFMPYVAFEGGYTRYGDARLLNSAGTTAARDHHYGVDVAVKGIFPVMATGLEVFAKVGADRLVSSIGSVDTAASAVDGLTFDTNGHSAMGLYLGGGFNYAITKSWAVNTQYERANGNSSTGNMDLVSVGLSFILDPSYY